MKVHQFLSNSPYGNYGYFIIDEKSQEALCVDPLDGEEILKILEKNSLHLKGVIYTHEHSDHFCGAKFLLKKFQCSVFSHFSIDKIVPGVDMKLQGGEKMSWGEGEIEFVYTPGHTMGHICLFLKNKSDELFGILTGDTLFHGGVGNTFNGGDSHRLYETIYQKLSGLPEYVMIYPGHNYLNNNLMFSTHVWKSNKWAQDLLLEIKKEGHHNFLCLNFGLEKKINPFLNLDNKSLRKDLNEFDISDEDLFLKLRALRDKW